MTDTAQAAPAATSRDPATMTTTERQAEAAAISSQLRGDVGFYDKPRLLGRVEQLLSIGGEQAETALRHVDELTPAEEAAGAADLYAPPAANTPYDFEGIVPDPQIDKTIINHEAVDQAATWMRTVEAPAWLARSVMQQVIHAGKHPPSVAEIERQGSETAEKLRGRWGASYDGNIALAKRVLAKTGGGAALNEMLQMTGLGSSAWLIETLVAFGQARKL